MRMVTFLTHTRGDLLLKPGQEFDATEEEAHAYAARKNPLAGPLEADEPPAAPKQERTRNRRKEAAVAPAPVKKPRRSGGAKK